MNIENGLITTARQHPSPNCSARPENAVIDLIVIHNISLPPGEFGGPFIDQFFTNQLDQKEHPYFEEIYQRRVSSHCFIRRDGEIVQYVPLHLKAWHAGESEFQGRVECNDFSIGIELEGTDKTPYTAEQYVQLSHLILCLQKHYPNITLERIVGHEHIAPNRKTDPGESFDWDRLMSNLRSHQTVMIG